MISEKIKELRKKAGMSQKDLADQLFVSPQAVSRWESGDTEPSAATLKTIAEIFKVSLDELFEHNVIAEQNTAHPQETVKIEYTPAPTVLGVCDVCKKAITDSNDYIKVHDITLEDEIVTTCRCRHCNDRIKEEQHTRAVANGIKCRKRAFGWGITIAAVLLAVSLITTIFKKMDVGYTIAFAVISALFFPFVSCLCLKNNFVETMFLSVASWGFVKFPGLIFSFDLGGLIWLIAVKILFWLIGIALAVSAFILAIALCLLFSLFVYPFALNKNIKYPEKSI